MSKIKLKRNFSILIWLSCLIKDLKEKKLRMKDLPVYFGSLFRVIFCRMKYIGINTKWATEWYWTVGGNNYIDSIGYSWDTNYNNEESEQIG